MDETIDRVSGHEADRFQVAWTGCTRGEECDICGLRGGAFCGRIAGGTLARLVDRRGRLDFAANHQLPFDSSLKDCLGVVQLGYLRLVHYTQDGNRRLVGLKCPGEFVGLQFHKTERLVLETATEARICRFDPAEYRRLMATDSGFRRLAYAQVRSEIDRLHYFSWSLAALSPRERLAGFLVLAARLMPWQPLAAGGGVLSMELSRLDIADLLGTTVETISRTTRKMARDGLIAIRDPQHFEIPCLDDLARLGGLVPAAAPA